MWEWVVPLGRAALTLMLCTIAVGFSIRPIRRRHPKFNITAVHRTLALITALLAILHVAAQHI